MLSITFILSLTIQANTTRGQNTPFSAWCKLRLFRHVKTQKFEFTSKRKKSIVHERTLTLTTTTHL